MLDGSYFTHYNTIITHCFLHDDMYAREYILYILYTVLLAHNSPAYDMLVHAVQSIKKKKILTVRQQLLKIFSYMLVEWDSLAHSVYL